MKHVKFTVSNIETIQGEFAELLDYQYIVSLYSPLFKKDLLVYLTDDQIGDYYLNKTVLRLVELN